MQTELKKLQKQYGECIDVLQRKQRRAESRDEFVDSVAGEALKRKDECLLLTGKFMHEAKKRSSMFILPDEDNDELIRTRPSPTC